MSMTPRQLEIFDYVVDFLDRKRYAPTLQEIGDAFDISRVTVLQHLRALEDKGFVAREPNKARSIEILRRPAEHRPAATDAGEAGSSKGPTMDGREEATDDGSGTYPLVGYIAAGQPLEAIENPVSFDVKQVIGGPEDGYLLEVRGDSMTGDHIRDGDLVLVRETADAREGQMVVALLDTGEATLKRFYREEGKVRLQPSNPEHDPVVVDEENVEIQGVVTGLLRNFRS